MANKRKIKKVRKERKSRHMIGLDAAEYAEIQAFRDWFRVQYHIPTISMARTVILLSRETQKRFNIKMPPEVVEEVSEDLLG